MVEIEGEYGMGCEIDRAVLFFTRACVLPWTLHLQLLESSPLGLCNPCNMASIDLAFADPGTCRTAQVGRRSFQLDSSAGFWANM